MRIAEKTFSYDDCKYGLVLRRNLITDDNWFGGRVYAFGKTKEGFLLCVEGEIDEQGIQAGTSAIIGVYIPTLEGISQEGIELLQRAKLISEPEKEEIKEEIIEYEIEADPEIEKQKETVDMVKMAEVTAKVSEIVNKKLESRPRRPSHPGKKGKR